jgi:D-alanyl-lipoteichoic acid acyltransferase DltB (MBOAT superfamily)
MTLTHWIRDYVFMTSYKAAATTFPRWAKTWSYGLLFVALFITGIWHGTTSGFAVFGILNGMGVAVNRAYGDALKAVLGRAGVERYLGNRLIQCLAIVATFHYECFCLLAFSSHVTKSAWAVFTDAVRQVMEIVQSIAHSPLSAASLLVLVIASLVAAGLWKVDALGGVIARGTAWLMSGTFRVHAIVYAQILIVVLLFCFDRTIEQEPPHVVYMRF